MKKKNIVSWLLYGCLIVTAVSCDDFLTENPTTSISDSEAFTSASDFVNNLSGTYYTLGRYGVMGRDVIAMGDACSDAASHNAASGNFRHLALWDVLDTNADLETMWQQIYQAIDRASRIIANADMVTDMPESSQIKVNGAIAQAYAIRAFATFWCVNIWGLPYNETNASTLGIVNVTEPVAAGATVSRNTVKENYEHVLSDIQKAKEYYSKNGVEDPGVFYFNPTALTAFEARVKLFMKDYSGAITAAQSVLDSFDGALATSTDVYTEEWSSSTASSEDIFLLKKSATDNPGSNSLSTLYQLYGLRVTPSIIAEYPATDIRLEAISRDGGKFSGTDEGRDASNIPVFRLPEMYLTLAEAYAEQGQYKTAKDYLVTLATARNAAYDAASVPETVDILSYIRQERKLELLQEGFRFFDARRWGIKIRVAAGKYTNFDAAKFCYPIPAGEVNSGFGVTQTQGWSANLPK